MKYLLQAIETSRHRVDLSDADLTKLLTDVQKSRDDRTLLHDSLERLLHDLRAQPHSQAFLARVNKRDAPDYYDVIKNPMDLSLMLKNVKSGKYRSKEAFRKDLDLIWDNCLLYNNEPTHPLRISANLMRKRSHDLLSYIQDSHDVKSALIEWVANHTSLTPGEAKALQRGDTAAVPGITLSTSSTFLGPVAAAASSTANVHLAGLSSTSSQVKDVLTAVPSSNVEEKPFDEQPALSIGNGAALAESVTDERRRDEKDNWALRVMLGFQPSALQSETSKGKRRMLVQPTFESETDDAEVEELVCSLAGGNSVAAGTSFNSASRSSSGTHGSRMQRATYSMPCLQRSPVAEPYRSRKRPSKEARHHQARDKREVNGHANGGPSHLETIVDSSGKEGKSKLRRRGVDCMKQNIKTHGKMHKLKRKFDFLDYCLDNDQPLPSSLIFGSDEEGEAGAGAPAMADDDVKLGEGSGSDHQWRSSKQQPTVVQVNGVNISPPPADDPNAFATLGGSSLLNPFPHISLPEARSALQGRISLLCGNAGFASSHSRPLDILTSILEEFISSLGRSLRLYLDRYGTTTMSPEEIVLHTLHATSSMGPNELAKYLFEDTIRYSHRLEDLKRKMEYSWKERITLGEERLLSEEDARFFGADGSEDLIVGNIPSALDDDFFGFKALGLDQELGVANLTIPARLFRGGKGGAAGRRSGEAGVSSKDKEGEREAFPTPPPFIRISEAALPAQIGLLRGFYRDILHRRGHRSREKHQRQQQQENPMGSPDADDEAARDGADDNDDEEDDELLAVSDDEVERVVGSTAGSGGQGRSGGGGGGGNTAAGLKIGQAGIMPKRDFWIDPATLARTGGSRGKVVNGGGANTVSTFAPPTAAAAAAGGGNAYAGKGGTGGTTGGKAKGGAGGKKGKSKKDS